MNNVAQHHPNGAEGLASDMLNQAPMETRKPKKIVIKFKELGKGLRVIRGKKTLKQLGAILSLQTSYLCEIENGNKLPSMAVVHRYGRKLNYEINLVLG